VRRRGGRRGAGGADGFDPSGIDEEVRFHIEGRAEELMAEGLQREEAWRRARSAFGDVERVRAELRAIGSERERRERVSGLLRDLRTGWRRLRRSPGYAVLAVTTLALGIGASVAMFTVLNAVLLRPLPYRDSERLVRVWPAENFNIALSRAVGRSLPAVSSFTGLSLWGMTLTGVGDPSVVRAAAVDAGYFETFGVHPALGREFGPEETEPSRSGVVLLGHAFWQTRFGGDPSVVGRRIHLSGYEHESREIIGVMPAGHQTLNEESDVWIPLQLAPGRTFAADSSWYVNEVVARLAPGATVAEADAQLRVVVASIRAEYPGRLDDETVQAASVISLQEAEVGDVRGLLWTLLAAVGLVLLIACANLANLVLARATGHRQEMAVRTALGAGRWRLVRQQLAEGAILALAGGVSGLLLARGLLVLARVSEASGLPRTGSLPIDGRVLAFTMVASLGALLLFGLLPALRATGPVLRHDLRSWTRSTTRDRGGHRLNRLLVTAEIGLSTMLVTAAALVLASFTALRTLDSGIDPEDVLTVELMPALDVYTGDRARRYYADVGERLAALPGVRSVGGIHLLPFTFNNWAFPYLAEGHTPRASEPLPSANFRLLTGDYQGAVDQPLLEGRAFTAADRMGAPPVMIVNRAMAELLWPGESAIGREIAVFGSMEMRVVGVAGDVRQHALDREPRPEMYVPFDQWPYGVQMTFMLEGPRVASLGAEVRRTIASIDADVPIASLRPLSEVLGESLARRRFVVIVMASFGLLALLLGAVGVYGVMTYLVGARLPDFGLRLALGAHPRAVLMGALGTGLVPAGAGLLLGIAGAMAASGLLRSLLFGIEPLNGPIYILVAGVLLTAAILASWLPARRAARSDPLSVLRAD
jgi:predicted permease